MAEHSPPKPLSIDHPTLRVAQGTSRQWTIDNLHIQEEEGIKKKIKDRVPKLLNSTPEIAMHFGISLTIAKGDPFIVSVLPLSI